MARVGNDVTDSRHFLNVSNLGIKLNEIPEGSGNSLLHCWRKAD